MAPVEDRKAARI